MKKLIRSILSIAMVLCLLSTSLFTGTFALSDSANILREDVISAINGLDVTADTTADDIIAAVTSVDAAAETTWKLEFTKVLPTNGAIITLNGVEVEGGTVRGFAGSIKGILNVTSASNNFDVAVDFTLEPTYETIDCKKQATINMTASTYKAESGYDAEADLVVIEQPSSGTQWSMPKNYFYTSDTDYDSTIKAVVVKYNVVNILDNAFRKMTALKAVVFPGIVKMYSNSFYASKVEYIDFGTRESDATSRTLEFATNAFAWTEVKNLYMGGYDALKIDKGAFTGCDQMKQMLIEIDTIKSVTSGALNTQGDDKPSITTVVCKNSEIANTFTTIGAKDAIDVSETSIVDYYGKVSSIKVIDEVTTDYVVSAAEALDTDNEFTVSAEKKDNVFEVSITDVNSITATAYVETFAKADIETNIKNILDEYSYTDGTTQDEITACVQNVLGSDYTITWLEDYSVSEKVDGAEVWARETEEDEYTLYGTVPGQDKATHGLFVIKKDTESVIIELNKILEKAEYEKYELNGVQKTNGAEKNGDPYDGASELVIVNGSTVYSQHLAASVIDSGLETSVSKNIKAIIVKGNFDSGAWTCFDGLTGLEVIIFDNPNITELGYAMVRNCTSLKYAYISDNVTTFKKGNSTNKQSAFYGCTSLGKVLVGANLDTNTFCVGGDNTTAVLGDAVIRYTADATVSKLLSFYNETTAIFSATSVEELDAILKSLPSYDESFTIEISENDNGFIVAINELLYAKVTAPTEGVIESNVETILDEYTYTDETTQSDITACIQNALGSGYTITWLEEYSISEKVDGAEVWARETEEDEYTLYGTVPGQDKATHGIFVINKEGAESVVIELSKVLEKAEYEKYELNGVQETDGSSGKSGSTYVTTYDGTSELVVVKGSTIYSQHLAAAAIDDVLGAGVSKNIKAIIVNGNFDSGVWTCFDELTGLEVIIFDNPNITELGYAMVRNCTSLKYAYISDNVTTLKKGTSTNKQSAFYGCSSLGKVLVGANLDKNTFCVAGDNTTPVLGDAVTRYTADASASKLVSFYNEVSAIPSAANIAELDTKLKFLPSYDESFTIAISGNDDGFTVLINDLLYVNMSITTPDGIKGNVIEALSVFVATNETSSDDIANAIIGVPGVQSVQWSDKFVFQKILATNGAQITYNGKIVDDGLVRGHAGSITGLVTVTTAFGDSFDAKIAITIDPTYEIINCRNKVNVTIDSDDDTYLTSGGNIFADLVIIDVTNPSNNIPANYFGATSTIKNGTIKAVIVKNEVTTVLEQAFQYTNALEAVVFNNVSGINNQAFWGSSVKYVEFGTATSDFSIGNANAFGWCKNIEGLYIANKNTVKIGNNSFDGCSNLTQIYVDAETVESVSTNAVNSNSSADGSITTVVCNGVDAVSKFEAAGALAVIDVADREISIYDVNYDFKVDARDLVRLKKMIATLTEDINYDVNNDGAVNATDLTAVRQELLDISKNNDVTFVGDNTKVSAATTVQNFGNYNSVSDNEALTLRNDILNAEDTIKASGNTWYISNDGDDTNVGNSPESPWKTLNALTKYADKIEAGDAVLLRRGDVFRGSRVTTESNVSYGAYGDEADKPAIYGSKLNYAEETWVRTENKNIYSLRADISTDIGMIIFNHGEAYGYKMLNSVSECDSDYEFYHDRAEGILYLYCSSGRPSDVFYDIELLYNESIIYVPNGAENVYIENISIKYTGAHGISVGMPVTGVTIKNCEVGWIGGSIHKDDNTRYGNGIQFYGQTTDAVVENCWVYQCYDAGLTHQYTGGSNGNPEMNATNISYINNLVEFCTYSLEYFWRWSVDGTTVENPNIYMKDILVENNVMRFAGYGLGKTRPDPTNMGHIATWITANNTSDNFVVKNNVFDMSTLRLFAVSTYEDSNPTFIGNRYIQSADKVLGTAYTNNKANGGKIAMNEEALSIFDATGTLTVVE